MAAGGFETYLESVGYARHVWNDKIGAWEVDKQPYREYSTYGPIIQTFIKGKTKIQYGIGESKCPPTLTHPVPYCEGLVEQMKQEMNTNHEDYIMSGAAYASRLLLLFSHSAVEEAIRLKQPLVYDALATPA